MVAPTSLVNVAGQSMDTIYGADGAARLKLAIGGVVAGALSTQAAWAGVATHQDGDTIGVGDGVALMAGSDGTLATKVLVDVDGHLLPFVAPASGMMTDRSGTITVGATRQAVCVANVDRRFFMFQNVSDTDMWINFGSDAVADQPSIKVAAGTTFRFDASFVDTQRVDVICATTGKKYTAKES